MARIENTEEDPAIARMGKISIRVLLGEQKGAEQSIVIPPIIKPLNTKLIGSLAWHSSFQRQFLKKKK